MLAKQKVKRTAVFKITDTQKFKMKMLDWLRQFNIFCLLDNHHYNAGDAAFECLVAAGCKEKIMANDGKAFEKLSSFNYENEWLFGHFAYDLKNEIEELTSTHFDGVGFDNLLFFIPQVVVKIKGHSVNITSDTSPEQIFEAIQSVGLGDNNHKQSIVKIESRFSKRNYIEAVKNIQQNILKGDCYEITFCQEFYAKDIIADPFFLYKELSRLSPSPFAALYRAENKFCICASPERYLKKTGKAILSQPVKGTAQRFLDDEGKDRESRLGLSLSEKEKSENVMIVDLVRNDLSKVCNEGSVYVDELFGVYSFPQVHQLISSIKGDLMENVGIADIVKATFPMGSMTGAPKKKVMELIEKYERTKRGLFSGAIGYIDPSGDFDFNVVIRSILYNATNKYLSFQAGSAITFYSDAEKEYEECLLKIDTIKKILGQ